VSTTATRERSGESGDVASAEQPGYSHLDVFDWYAMMRSMRTTVTIDADLAAKLRRIARERGVSFKDALNATLRAGIGTDAGLARRYRLRARSLKLRPGIDLDRALRLATTLEDEEVIRKLELRT